MWFNVNKIYKFIMLISMPILINILKFYVHLHRSNLIHIILNIYNIKIKIIYKFYMGTNYSSRGGIENTIVVDFIVMSIGINQLFQNPC
jgi:hypothetical protein